MPTNDTFFSIVDHNHEACIGDSRAYAATDAELSRAIVALDATLIVLDRTASCTDGCDGGDHALERLLTRSTSISVGAWTLAERGQYDEAMILIRSLGEMTNLLSLFAANPSEFTRWQNLSYRDRRREFDPAPTRKRLTQDNVQVWMDDGRYSELCEKSVHAVPSINPQVFDRSHRPNSGGCFQPNGLAQCVFELAVQVSGILIAASTLKRDAKHLATAGEALLRSVPGVTLLGSPPAP
jgi:hypothetical protein